MRASEEVESRDGPLKSLTLRTAGGEEFHVELKPGGAKLETWAKTAGGERAVGRVLNYEARSEGRRLGGELDILARDSVYEDALRVVARLLASAGA